MIDHVWGKPSPTWKRTQVFLVILFWVWRLYVGDGQRRRKRLMLDLAQGAVKEGTMKEGWERRLRYRFRYRGGIFGIMGLVNRKLKLFSPYQLLVGTLTLVYAIRNLDVILGLQAPEPLARMYSRSYYRASYIAVAFDSGFATAMTVRPKWLRDICSVLFSGYYLVWAHEADEKLRRYRAVCTVEMLRVTWEKQLNPYVRLLTYFDRPPIDMVRKILLPRPKGSKHDKPVSGMLFFARPQEELANATELILDFPGGGFIAMGPECHEERLRRWAKRTGKPVLSIDYGKAPEYPYPWAIEECFDVYRTLVETKGSAIGMQSGECHIILTGDSAGGNVACTVMFHILESETPIPHPIALVLAYPALDFNFTSWMTPDHLRTLRTEQSTSNIPGLEEGKDHMRHRSPLAVVDDREPTSPRIGRTKSWKKSIMRLASTSTGSLLGLTTTDDEAEEQAEADKSLQDRVKTPFQEKSMESLQRELQRAVNSAEKKEGQIKAPIGTRLTMTSRTGYFQDRIISPSMMRAMAILYIGPKHNPDFQSDYYISPILAPEKLLAQFPRIYLICGERDPFVDDTVILAGRVRQAKRHRRAEAKQKQMIKIGRVRETLRMSATRRAVDMEEDPIVYEEEDDWIQMRIIEKWSHGFLNMVGVVLPEAEGMIHDMADWIDETFAHSATTRAAERRQRENGNGIRVGYGTNFGNANGITTAAPLQRPAFNLVKPAESYKTSRPSKTLGSADLGTPFKAENNDGNEDEGEDGDEVLSFSTRKSTRSGDSSTGSNGERISNPPRVTTYVPRNSSAPRFDVGPDLESSNETENVQGIAESIRQAFSFPGKTLHRNSPKSQFAFFGSSQSESPRLAPAADSPRVTAIGPSRYYLQPPSQSSPGGPLSSSAAGGGTPRERRTDSPSSDTSGAAARATKLLQSGLTEAEMMRRRRMEAVYGMTGETPSDRSNTNDSVAKGKANDVKVTTKNGDDNEEEEGEVPRVFRWGD